MVRCSRDSIALTRVGVTPRFGAPFSEPAHGINENGTPNTSAMMLVFENTWAARFATAVRNANGEVLEYARIPAAAVAQAMMQES